MKDSCVQFAWKRYSSHYERLYLTVGTQMVTISLVSSSPNFITCHLLATGMF